jgi:site-specific DNA-methyltransferase (adenine-specific)
VLPINEIICGDNVATMQTFPDACIDLVVTSPPYDNLRTYGGHSWDFEGVAQQLWRVIKPGGVVVWVVADATIDGSETGTSFRQALRFMEIGFRLHDTMIYQKLSGGIKGSQYAYLQGFEFMFVLSKEQPSTINLIQDRKNIAPAGTKIERTGRKVNGDYKTELVTRKEYGIRWNVWSFQVGSNVADAIAFKQPAIFPEALARDHILSWSNEGDTVLDPFSGSGTTAKMARLMGRQYIGIEVNPEYCEIAKNRLRQKVLEFSVDSAEDNR